MVIVDEGSGALLNTFCKGGGGAGYPLTGVLQDESADGVVQKKKSFPFATLAFRYRSGSMRAFASLGFVA